MRYGIITTGSRGDIQPFIALALALMDKGHDVTLVAPENFNHFIEGFGIPFKPVAGHSERLINSPEALKLLEGGNIFKFFYHLQKAGAEFADRANRDMLEACREVDYLIVSVLPLPIVYCIAEKLQKKCALVFLSMSPIPTRAFPFEAVGTSGPGWFNKLSYRLVGLSYAMISKNINRFRKEIGLPPANVLKACLRSDMPAMLTQSKELVERPADWPANAHVTGFFYLPPSIRETKGIDKIPEGLEAWLAQGDKPLYIGFGSIPVPDPSRLYQTLNGILTEHRVVFCAGWSILPALPEHPNLFVAKYIDHDWLLPRCRMAVIHGGIGTIGAALRSGIPIIVISILADQPHNGKMLEQKKLGFHIPFKKLTPERLLQAVRAAEDPMIVENCKATGARVRTEDGVGHAVKIIEAYFEKAG